MFKPTTLTLSYKMDVTINQLDTWTKEVSWDPISALAGTLLQNQAGNTSLLNRDALINSGIFEFNNVIEVEGAPITNQKSSGRCWIFTTCNILRVPVMKKYNLSELQLSQTYLYFYDKLEKSNYFLDQMCQTAGEPVDSRIVQHLLTDPIQDGGQFDMIVNIIEKYGLVPQYIYPEAHSSGASSEMCQKLTALLRQYGQELRDAIEKKENVDELKKIQIKEIHRLLVLYLGAPPSPNSEFKWQFSDKDKKYGSLVTTPMKFYNEVVETDLTKCVSLVNDPRNPYNKALQVDRLGNVVGAKPVTYINVEADVMAKYAMEKIKRNEPVFFGNDTPAYLASKQGIFDLDIWNYHLVGYKPTQDKASRLRYHQSLMTHAMTLVGFHEENGMPVRWKIQNSWGDEKGKKGVYMMTHEYFEEYVYQVVVNKEDIGDLAKCLEDKEPIVLPAWDPMGSLAA